MIARLAEAAGLGPALVGGKAANLAHLAAAGYPVPAGFVIPVPDQPADEELRRAAADLGGGRFAVRSSAVAEDSREASHAGLYETSLNVPPDQLGLAVRRCRDAAAAPRVRAYRGARAGAGVAVLVQRMVDAQAAGVAFTANPLTGAHDEVVVTATHGLGERLVSGRAIGEEWVVGRRGPTLMRPGGVLNARQAAMIADLARRVATQTGEPQDIEWAIESGRLYLLQARPMTALPAPVCWDPPGGGLWLRNLRLGEWLPDPLTPLFADWLLPRIDEGMRQAMREMAGVAVPFPAAVVNGWYYTHPVPRLSALLGALLRSRGKLARFMVDALICPGQDPAAADRRLLGRLYRQWRDELLPAYRELARQQVDTASQAELARLVDEVGRMAGRCFWHLIVVGGAAWKMEACLARFLARHRLEGVDPQALLGSLPTGDPAVSGHAVYSIDWFHPTAAETGTTRGAATSARREEIEQRRERAEEACRHALADRPRLIEELAAVLQTARRYAAIRERQARELTLGWPLLRTCVQRTGQELVAAGVLDDPVEVFFLTRAEIGVDQRRADLARARRSAWERQRRLVAPLRLGAAPPLLGRHLEHALGLARAPGPGDVLTGQAASAGRVSGPVRIVDGPQDFPRVCPGDVLVARTTAPAWTPLFSRVAAVVTDGGTLAAHASLIAREYGIPAVVATGDATSRLRDGQVVTVDGSQGVVWLHGE